MKWNLINGFGFYLAMVAFGIPMIVNTLDHLAREREMYAAVYAIPSQVHFTTEGQKTVVTGVTRKLEDCSVPKGNTVAVVASWRDASGFLHVRDFPATRVEGDEVKTAPLVLKGGEFQIGPFIIPLRRDTIQDVYIRFPCEYPSGVRVMAQIGPLTESQAQ